MATKSLILLDPQHPNSILEYGIGFTDWLAESGDALATATVTASNGINIGDGGVAPAPLIDDFNNVIFWISGGISGQTYTGQVVVTTTNGRTEVIDWQISIIDPTP
jgi:hypothetical protein